MVDGAELVASIESLDFNDIRVLPQYIDGNGHMNIAYYTIVFEQALDRVWQLIGLRSEQFRREHKSTFTLETHVTYQREVKLGDPLHFGFRIVDLDSKRLHIFATMEHAAGRMLAATFEQLIICIDMTKRRSATWPEGQQARLAAVHEIYKPRPAPPEIGRTLQIRRR
jgi:acyl-CoA thioester hydrolase